MRALIVGAGAVGRYVAARLKLAGHDPVLLARSPAPGGDGEYVLRMKGAVLNVTVPIAVGPDDAALREPFELTAFAVKAFSTAGAIESVRSIAACANSTLLTLQNGLGNEELCAAAFGDDRVVAAALTTAVGKTVDGITASDRGGLSIAPVGKLPHNWLIAALALTGIETAAVADWRALKWSKLCINLQANAVCAILDWTPEQVYSDKLAFSIERRCLLEAINVMRALKLTPVPLIDFPVPLLVAAARSLPPSVLRILLASRVGKARGGKLPSLLIAARSKQRETEVDALNGAVAERAVACGVAAPGNGAVARILNGILGDTVAWDDFRGKPSALLSAIDSQR